MKVWLTVAAAVALSVPTAFAENAATKLAKAPGKTIVTTGENTIRFGKGVYKIAGKAGRKAVRNLVDSGKCAKNSEHPGAFVACGVRLVGGQTVVIWKLGARQGANAAYYVGRVGADTAEIWRDAFRSCSKSLGEVAGIPCQAVALGFSASGKVIWAAAVAVGDTFEDGAYHGSKLIYNAFEVPASLLELDPRDTGKAVLGTAEGAICLTADVVLLIPRFVAGIFDEDLDGCDD